MHGGTSGRSDRLEQERQCVHNPSRNAHGRLYRQFSTVARILSLSLSLSLYLSLSLSLLGFCTLDPASIGSFGSGCMWVGSTATQNCSCETASRRVAASFSTFVSGGRGSRRIAKQWRRLPPVRHLAGPATHARPRAAHRRLSSGLAARVGSPRLAATLVSLSCVSLRCACEGV